jgi:cutinase
MKHLRALMLSVMVSLGLLVPATVHAQTDQCVGSWGVGIGGLAVGGQGTWQSSSYVVASHLIGYNSADPQDGLNQLTQAIDRHRWVCPGDHITVLGHSEGAGIVHAWVTAHNGYGNTNAVLLADPKRVAGPGWAGLASIPGNQLIGYPLAGVDDWFGDVPVLEVCNHDDMICNTEAGWFGYFTGAHTRYDANVFHYGDWDNGVLFY